MVSTVEDRFWAKVEPTGFCWDWSASKTAKGYGQFRQNGRMVYAHRTAYEMLIGPIPDGMQIDHLCRNRACVNPDHLEPVTSRENTSRGLSGSPTTHHLSVKTHCPHGHPYSGDNLYIPPSGQRVCRRCLAENQRRYRERKRQMRRMASNSSASPIGQAASPRALSSVGAFRTGDPE